MNQRTLQRNLVLERMRAGPATALDLEISCGASQAHTRMKELRELGCIFADKWIQIKTRFGEKKVKQYTLTFDPFDKGVTA